LGCFSVEGGGNQSLRHWYLACSGTRETGTGPDSWIMQVLL
jgi:hypothetical protein